MPDRAIRAAKYAFTTFLFLISLAIGARWIGGAFPSTDNRFFDRKLAQFAEADPPYDVIFCGSSRVYRHIHPATFDSVMSANGNVTRSYNFGYTGTTPLELPHQLGQILNTDQAGVVEWVFVSLEGLETRLENMNLRSDRVARYHDGGTFARYARLLFANENVTPSDRWNALYDRVPPFFIHYTGHGRGGTWFRRWAEAENVKAAKTWWQHEDGFLSLDSAFVYAEGAAKKRLVKRRDKLRNVLAGGDSEAPEAAKLDLSYQQPVLEELIADISAVVRSYGARVVFLERTMDAEAAHDLLSARQCGVLEHLISLDDAGLYPELHSKHFQFDEGHYGAEGAEFFTRYLAEGFLPIVKRSGATR